jgi:hypothetical protein
MAKFKILHFVAGVWVATPLTRRNNQVAKASVVGPSHLVQTHRARRRMLKEAGADHRHLQSCVAIPVTDPYFVQGIHIGVIVGREDDG